MKRRETIKALVWASLATTVNVQQARGGGQKVGDEARERRIKWFREAKFGMFIHWGLYAIPAGIWKGKEIPGLGEWIMFRARIPVKEVCSTRQAVQSDQVQCGRVGSVSERGWAAIPCHHCKTSRRVCHV